MWDIGLEINEERYWGGGGGVVYGCPSYKGVR